QIRQSVESHGQLAARFGKAWRDVQRLLEKSAGGLKQSQVAAQHAHEENHFTIARVLRMQSLVELGGIIQPTGRVVLERQRQVFLARAGSPGLDLFRSEHGAGSPDGS